VQLVRSVHELPRHLGGTVFEREEPHNPYVIEEVPFLLSRCWCDSTDVSVPTMWVREGLTSSCGRAKCKELS
jgi:hypothetical protein